MSSSISEQVSAYLEAHAKSTVSVLPDTSALYGKSVLITGGTGLLGSALIRVLDTLNLQNDARIRVLGMARSPEKAAALGLADKADWVYGNLSDAPDIPADTPIDYIIHTASPTDSLYFTTHPVEVIRDTVTGLSHILDLAREKKSAGVVFTSSMEVYGRCTDDVFLTEDKCYPIDFTSVRSCYSEGKRLLECLCCSYAAEYGVPVSVVRLAQSVGPGIAFTDNRVLCQFARSVVEGHDIVLATKGETKRSYLSLSDSVSGVLTVLMRGRPGEAYNLASDGTYRSIYELACLFARGSRSDVRIEEKQDGRYLSTLAFGLDTSKIKSIGYVSTQNIDDIARELIEYFSMGVTDTGLSR